MAVKQDMRGRVLSFEQRLEVCRRFAAGESTAEVAKAVGCMERTARRIRKQSGGITPRISPRSDRVLSLSEREDISRGLHRGDSLRAIAGQIERCVSTISREVANNGGRISYRAVSADQAAYWRSRRPKRTKLSLCSQLREQVEAMLELRWSPQQIAARLAIEFPNDPAMRVSHETIYRSLFVQSKGALRKDLTAYLRTGRTRRRPPGRSKVRGQIKDMVLISERPAEVEDRAVPGHWEGDLIIGKAGKSGVATLVERKTRYVMLVYIGYDQTTQNVCKAIAMQIRQLPAHLTRSLTWDRGKELTDHMKFSIDTGVEVFFCDPRAPWQRGSNENTNGLLRQYLPKGTDLAVHSQTDLDRIAAELNGRPRQTLDWMKPAEKMAELLR